MKRYTDYDNFAWLYNQEFKAFGENIFPAIKTIARDSLVDSGKVLDLCCGTGQLAKVLTEKGYQVTGIDGSREMLRYARGNAPDAKFIAGDARTFRLPPEYKAVFSTFDSLNHVMTLKELEKIFGRILACLVKGGIFVFDMTTRKHFEVATKDYKDVREKPECLYIIRTKYDAKKKLGEWAITIFRPEGTLWERSEVTLYQTWYPIEDIKLALVNAGFSGVRAHSFSAQREIEEGTEDSDRVFFYAQKP